MTTSAPRVLVLGRSDVAELLGLSECIAAVEEAFRREAEGSTLPAGVLSIPAAGGGFHVKAAGTRGERAFFAAKVNANFAGNRERFGLPTIQGVILFFSFAYVLINLLVDVSYVFFDPRIRY